MSQINRRTLQLSKNNISLLFKKRWNVNHGEVRISLLFSKYNPQPLYYKAKVRDLLAPLSSLPVLRVHAT